MDKTLIFSDSHICNSNIIELKDIFAEIMNYKADRVICLGDYYDRKLLNAEELIFGTNIMKQFVEKYSEVIMLEGNHDKETIKYIIDLGVKVFPSIVIDNNYYGHFFVDKSIKSFNSAKRSLTEFDEYNFVFLGHQHSFQVLKEKRIHPGSIAWIDFGEVDDTSKNIIMLENDKIDIIELKSPIPMIDIFNKKDLDKLGERYKVRYVIKDFNQLKVEANELEQYKDKFYQFKIKLDFENKEDKVDIFPKKNINEILNDWLKKIKDQAVKLELESAFSEDKC